MKLLKRITSSSVGQALIAALGYVYIRFAYATTRWTFVGKDAFYEHIRNDIPTISVVWHGHLAIGLLTWPKGHTIPSLSAVVSAHNDGQLLTRLLRLLGIRPITGSSGGKRAYAALKETIALLHDNKPVAITPDGPRGPRHSINGSVIEIAQKTGAAIIPVSYATTRFFQLRSWDKFILPLPFARGVIIYGDAITIPKNSTKRALEDSRESLRIALNNTTLEAERLCQQ